MTFAEGWHQTPQGRVFVRWERADAQICLHIEVPTGARGWIVLEDGYKFADTGTTKRLLESGSFFAKIIKHLFRRYPGTAAGNPFNNRIFRSAP